MIRCRSVEICILINKELIREDAQTASSFFGNHIKIISEVNCLPYLYSTIKLND